VENDTSSVLQSDLCLSNAFCSVFERKSTLRNMMNQEDAFDTVTN